MEPKENEKKAKGDGQLHRFAETGDMGRRRRRRLGIRGAQAHEKAPRAGANDRYEGGEDEGRREVDGDQNQDQQEATGGVATAGGRGGLAATASSRWPQRAREALEAEATEHTGVAMPMRCIYCDFFILRATL